ncbi:MAG: glycosyltransferase family 4 protein [Halobacteriales archaeon]|nr:glycosyltransferase family 4 protein [Halobacteriales archaeon]
MKAALLGWEFPPFMAGGLGIHCLELTRGLAQLGVEVDFYMPRMPSLEGELRVADHHGHLRIREVEADPAAQPYGGGNRTARYERNFNAAVALYNERLVAAFDSFDADVLHCHDWITVPAALELRRRTGIPLVFTVHSTEFDRSAGWAPQAWIEGIERRGIHGADRVIAVSRYTKGLVERLYGADPARTVAVHNGVDAAQFRPERERDYGAGGERVLFLSRLSRQKGPLYFLRAAERILEQRPEAQIVMAGKGEMLAECIDYAVRRGIASQVQFPGFVGADDLAAFYAHHDVYVLPSVSEPFGISVLEAMGSGLPTVVSRTSGVGEAVRHVLRTEYWDTDEMADLTLRLLGSEELRRELGQNAAREAGTFTWLQCSRRTLEVYHGVARGAGMPRPKGLLPPVAVPTT